MKRLTAAFAATLALGLAGNAVAYDPEATIADLDSRLAKIGAPRIVGTLLARNAAYEAVSQGKPYCGSIDVLGTAFDACYHPIKDASGKIVGVSYFGHRKS